MYKKQKDLNSISSSSSSSSTSCYSNYNLESLFVSLIIKKYYFIVSRTWHGNENVCHIRRVLNDIMTLESPFALVLEIYVKEIDFTRGL